MAISTVLAEQNVLRMIIDSPSTYITKVDPEYFVSPIAKSIFLAIKTLYENQIRVTPRSLFSEVSKTDSSIDEAKIIHLFEIEVPPDDVPGVFEFHYSSLRKEYAKNKLQMKGQEVLIESSRKGDFNTEAIVKLRNEIDRQLEIIQGKPSIILTGNDLINFYEEELKERASHYYSTGDKYLDDHVTMGEWPGTQTALYAATGMGKTDYALFLFAKQINKKIPCVYISLEMPKGMLMDRIIAAKYQIPMDKFYPKPYDEEGMPDYIYDLITKEKEAMLHSPFFRLVDVSSLSLEELEDIARKIKQEMNVKYLNIFTDLMSMVNEFNNSEEGMNKADAIESSMNKTNAIAKRNDIHLFNIFQANRAADNVRLTDVEDVNRLRPSLNNIKSSGAIAERSRLVLSAFRARYYVQRYLPDAPELLIMEDILEIDILKQSQGGPARLQYLFDGPTARITRYVEDSPDPTPDHPIMEVKTDG